MFIIIDNLLSIGIGHHGKGESMLLPILTDVCLNLCAICFFIFYNSNSIHSVHQFPSLFHV